MSDSRAVIVTGGRNFDNAIIYSCLNDLHGMFRGGLSKVIHGGCSGADRMAQIWADDVGVPTKVHEADWGKHGKAAGPIRNREMIQEHKDESICLLAMPGGRGTENCIKNAEKVGMEIMRPSDFTMDW